MFKLKLLFNLSKLNGLYLYVSKFGNSITVTGLNVIKKIKLRAAASPRLAPLNGIKLCRYYSTGLVNYNNQVTELINKKDCFYILVFKSNKHKLGEGVSLSFVVNSPDKFLLNELSKILGVSSANIVVRKTCYSFTVKDFKTITEKVIPFFEKCYLHENKQETFKY